jgi:acetyl-CoA C-acetyltransferase
MKVAEEQLPVLVGAAQLVQRDVDLGEALGPLEMLERVSRDAAEDAGVAASALERLDTIAVIDAVAWRTTNAPRLVADALHAKPSRELTSGVGGEVPVAVLNELAQRIAEGRSEMALLTGCNNVRSMMRARKEGVALDWATPTVQPGEPEVFRETLPGASELEKQHGLASPTQIYPIFENALRARHGAGLEEHRARMGELFHPFTVVAAANPYAWFPVERSAHELVTPTSANRMIGFPYTKYLNAVMETDQAAAVLLMSAGTARELGVPKESLVYWRGGADAIEEAWFPTERPDLGNCPAMEASQRGALERAGITLDEVDRFDFYSCFPSAVGMACEVLGLEPTDPRGLTVTGGLPYAGGPGNNYSTHAIATMVDELRAGRGKNALVTGNGWYLTKHSAAVLSSSPPLGELAAAGTAAVAEASGKPEIAAEASGLGTIETYTVLYGRDNVPERGVVVGRLDDGKRFIANTPGDRTFLEAFAAVEAVGRTGKVTATDDGNRIELD